MADLFWPGDERAGHHFSSASFLWAMVSIEGEWLGRDLDVPDDLAGLTHDAEAGGNPVIPLVRMLRDQLDEDAERLHRGFTSQDVVDLALMRMAEAAVSDLRLDLEGVVEDLVRLAEEHRDTPMVARTLTQHAVPPTFGFRVATWLTAVLDAYDDLARLGFPRQLGARRAPARRWSSSASTRPRTTRRGTPPGRRSPASVTRWPGARTRAPASRTTC
ncbi:MULTISPECIES: lyase family protein [unclassified Nocardioides]|uniref:lyase family protein n=1 Tax=unclassified Nocardioides TaxID=2615069 RepID=UPI00030FBC56|nr:MULTISPECIES: lyase family protein [unclassified Nocardioides]